MCTVVCSAGLAIGNACATGTSATMSADGASADTADLRRRPRSPRALRALFLARKTHAPEALSADPTTPDFGSRQKLTLPHSSERAPFTRKSLTTLNRSAHA